MPVGNIPAFTHVVQSRKKGINKMHHSPAGFYDFCVSQCVLLLAETPPARRFQFSDCHKQSHEVVEHTSGLSLHFCLPMDI